jgi:hypothetical protein
LSTNSSRKNQLQNNKPELCCILIDSNEHSTE